MEYVEEDAALRAALEEQEESDKEETDYSVSLIPMTLKEARSAAQAVQHFVQETLWLCIHILRLLRTWCAKWRR